jgi:uncharacterized protein involved in cysteine biosynthesis
MSHVPSWVGHVGFILIMMFCLSIFANLLWLILLTFIACFVMVVVENRYERELLGSNSER